MTISSLHRHRLTVEQRSQNKELVINWMLEHRFSRIKILTALMGCKSGGANVFFEYLIEDEKVLGRYKSSVTKQRDLVRGGHILIDQIKTMYDGVDDPEAVRLAKKERKKYEWLFKANAYKSRQLIHHDLALQSCLLNYVSNLCEMKSVWNCPKHWKIKPDALVRRLGTSKWIAVEFELSAKDALPIYHKFREYRKLLESGELSEVHFFFNDESLCRTYENYFYNDWPLIINEGGKLIFQRSQAKEIVNGKKVHKKIREHIPSNDPVRSAVKFIYQDPNHFPVVKSRGAFYEKIVLECENSIKSGVKPKINIEDYDYLEEVTKLVEEDLGYGIRARDEDI